MILDGLLARVLQRGILERLAKLEAGRLTLHLPDGSVHTFAGQAPGPQVTVWVDDPRFFRRYVVHGDIGAGESYMDAQWRADDLPGFMELVLRNREHLGIDTAITRVLNLGNDLLHRLRANTRRGSRRNVRHHYDLGNELFGLFLDETLTYSSAVFQHAEQGLREAQRNKYRMMAEKVLLGPRDHVLEIGCGWGGFALFAAREYGCRVTGITLSPRQLELASRRVAEAGLQHRVDLRLQDFRDVTGCFDKIVSIEMFEALGLENWAGFFGRCDALLAPEGLMALQAISIPDHRFEEYSRHSDWLQKYIFPGSLLASLHHATGAMIAASRLGVVHLEDIGIHYAETLRRWRRAFLENLDSVRALGYDERFIRMWDYYLSTCEAAFATRTLGNLQLVLTRPGNRSLPGIPARRAQVA